MRGSEEEGKKWWNEGEWEIEEDKGSVWGMVEVDVEEEENEWNSDERSEEEGRSGRVLSLKVWGVLYMIGLGESDFLL